MDNSVAGRQLTDAEKEIFLAGASSVSGITLWSEPSSYYNCHSYAWYMTQTANPYWVSDITPYLNDSQCSAIDSANVQVKDIIAYADASGMIIDSGYVQSIDSNGNPIICSKWGQGGAYVHGINQVPNDYKISVNGQSAVLIGYYRYHDYNVQYTGSNYHSGRLHYLQYYNQCSVCGKKSGSEEWISFPCKGNPCIMPFSLREPDELY